MSGGYIVVAVLGIAIVTLVFGGGMALKGDVSILAAPWLGHGRAVECFLTCVAAMQGLILLFDTTAAYDSKATVDLAWWGYGQWLALPFLVKATLSGSGLIFNIHGLPYSRALRFSGAFVGCMIWTWYAAKLLLLGAPAAMGTPFCIMSALFSMRIMGLALAGLPRPGAPGAMGL